MVDAYIVLAQAHHARGDAAGTFEHLAHARSLVREVGMHAAMLARIDAAEVRARIAVDDLDRAQLLLAGVPQGCRGVLEARLALARGDDDQAWARLVGGHAVRLPLRLCIEREVVLACASACRPSGPSATSTGRWGWLSRRATAPASWPAARGPRHRGGA